MAASWTWWAARRDSRSACPAPAGGGARQTPRTAPFLPPPRPPPLHLPCLPTAFLCSTYAKANRESVLVGEETSSNLPQHIQKRWGPPGYTDATLVLIRCVGGRFAVPWIAAERVHSSPTLSRDASSLDHVPSRWNLPSKSVLFTQLKPLWYPGWAACVVHAVVGPLQKQALMTSISIQGYDQY